MKRQNIVKTIYPIISASKNLDIIKQPNYIGNKKHALQGNKIALLQHCGRAQQAERANEKERIANISHFHSNEKSPDNACNGSDSFKNFAQF